MLRRRTFHWSACRSGSLSTLSNIALSPSTVAPGRFGMMWMSTLVIGSSAWEDNGAFQGYERAGSYKFPKRHTCLLLERGQPCSCHARPVPLEFLKDQSCHFLPGRSHYTLLTPHWSICRTKKKKTSNAHQQRDRDKKSVTRTDPPLEIRIKCRELTDDIYRKGHCCGAWETPTDVYSRCQLWNHFRRTSVPLGATRHRNVFKMSRYKRLSKSRYHNERKGYPKNKRPFLLPLLNNLRCTINPLTFKIVHHGKRATKHQP